MEWPNLRGSNHVGSNFLAQTRLAQTMLAHGGDWSSFLSSLLGISRGSTAHGREAAFFLVPQGSCGHRNVRPGGNQPTNGASFRLDHPTPCKNVRDLVKCGLWTPKRLRCGAGGHASARGATPRDKTRQRCTSAKTSPGALYKYQLGGAAGSYPFRAQEYDVEINLSALLSHFDAFPGPQETCRCAARRDTAEVQMAILRRSGYDTGHEAMLRCEGGGVTTERAGQNALD